MSARLLATLIKEWDTLDGFALSRGLPDLRTLPLGRVCNLVYWHLTRNGDEQGIAKLRARLWQPPKGVAVTDSRSPWAPENENKALASLGASLGLSPSGGRSSSIPQNAVT